MIRFSVGKTEIVIDIGFLAVIALVSMSRKYSFSAFAACIVHEAGHLVMSGVNGYRTERILLSITGVSIESVPGKLHSFAEDLMVIYGGIMANVIAGTVALITGCSLFGTVNLVIAALNALPFSVLDGGSAADIISEKYYGVNRYSVLTITSGILALVISVILFCFFSQFFFSNISALIFLVYITANEIKYLSYGLEFKNKVK